MNRFCTATIGVFFSACFELADRDVDEREVADLACALHVDQHVERLAERDVRLREPAQVHDRQLLELERLEIVLEPSAQLSGVSAGAQLLSGSRLPPSFVAITRSLGYGCSASRSAGSRRAGRNTRPCR